MSRALIYRAIAKFDIRNYADRYELKSAGLGVRFAQAAADTIDRLLFMPFIYAPVSRRKIRFAPIRKFPFAVLYRVKRSAIEIIAVIPTKSDPINWPVKP